MSADLAAAYAHCEQIVGTAERDAWLAALFAPAESRPHLHALDAFLVEIGQVRARVRQPLAGEIRLQWWQDAIEGAARGDTESSPVAAALLDTVARKALPRDLFGEIIEAHRLALYPAPPAGVADFERAADETHGATLRLRARVLAGPDLDDAAPSHHAAVALGIAALLTALPRDAAEGRVALPADLLARHGVVEAEIAAGRAGPGLAAALADLRFLARGHLTVLKAQGRALPEAAAPAYLRVALVEPVLRRSEKAADPFSADLASAQWRRQWWLWRAARRGGLG